MGVIEAIALLCQVATGSHVDLNCVANHQLRCQKAYVECYEKKIGTSVQGASTWYGPLKDCIKEKPIIRLSCEND